ncbi:MAG: RIP metalloprotease RseP [Cyanobacteria bacterium SIG32]|nr:RIP metalloprotease RseP [Cyanobacteria bacterium SIG32]
MSVIIMILLLSVLILVHEAGHFLAAKAFKMKVSKFGFGLPIGPTLWEKQVGDVKVLIHAFLLGGYVAFPDDDKDLDLPKDSPDRFLNRPIYQRAVVVSAGVIANIICAFVFVLLTAFLWGNMPSGKYEVYINKLLPEKNQQIEMSGLQQDDKVIKINGSEITTSYALSLFAQQSKKFDGKADESFVEENYTKLKKLNPAYKENEVIPEDVLVQLPPFQTEKKIVLNKNVLRGYERYVDKQISLNTIQKDLREKVFEKKYIISDGTLTLKDIAYAISDNVRPLNITVLRGDKEVEIKPIYPTEEGLIGVQLNVKEVLIPVTGVKSAIVTSGKYLYDQTYMLLYGLYQIFTGKIPLKDLHGIIAITKVGGDIIDNSGIFSGLLLIAIISLDLAIVNFLPIPALDGGHIMFLIIEKIKGRPLEEEVIDKIGTAGFLFLILLMVFVIFNDLFALITKQI